MTWPPCAASTFEGSARSEAYRRDGERYYIVDGHIHFWDASPENQANKWHGDSKGWDLRDPWSIRYLEKCQELGVTNIHVHKGPTIWPLNKDSFDVSDVDDVASAFTELNFIIEHVGLPRLEDFCWIAIQEPNVYGGLAVAIPFIPTRPRYFGQVIGELLYWLGEDRILFASDYAIWTPRWLIDKFLSYEMPADLRVPEQQEAGFETAERPAVPPEQVTA